MHESDEHRLPSDGRPALRARAASMCTSPKPLWSAPLGLNTRKGYLRKHRRGALATSLPVVARQDVVVAER